MMEQIDRRINAKLVNQNSNLTPEMDMIAFVSIFTRRKLLISATALICLALGMLFVMVTPPRYLAESMVIIRESSNPLSALPVAAGIRNSTTYVTSQAELIQSPTIARRVIRDLSLQNDRELNPNARSRADLSFADIRPQELAEMLDIFDQRMSAQIIPGSSIIQINFSSRDPEKAAQIANSIAENFIAYQTEKNLEENERVARWLDNRIAQIREDIDGSKSKLDAFRQEKSLYDSGLSTLQDKEIQEINRQLTEARIAYSTTYARLQAIKKYNKKSGGSAGSDFLRSNLIDDLKKIELQAQQEISELSARYGEKHPQILAAKARLNEIQTSIRTEISSIETSLSSELEGIEEQVSQLEQDLAEAKTKKEDELVALSQLKELETEFNISKNLYETFLKNQENIKRQAEIQPSDVQIISLATAPLEPNYPNAGLVFGLSGLMGLFLGLGLALLTEKLNYAFRTIAELETFSALPNYGAIPQIGGLKDKDIAGYITKAEAAPAADMVRSVRMAIGLRGEEDGKEPKIVTITSSIAGEGKTTLSAWLAAVSARSGEKVIVVDCDFRRSTLATAFNKPNQRGLVDYLSGDAALEDIIYREHPSGAHVIFGRDVPGQALDLINSKRMKTLIESLGKAYDLVILDAPTSINVSDALVLAKLSDAVLYCVAWNSTVRDSVGLGLKSFYNAQIHKISTVLTRVRIQDYKKFSKDLDQYMR